MTAITSEPNARSERKPPGNGRLGNSLTIVLTMFGVALAGTTTFIMNRSGVTPEAVTYVLLADLAFLVILVAMIARKVWRLLSARGERAAGARLHLRLTGIFAIVALAPTVIVAAFATLSVNVGIERMFSTQVGSVVRNSLSTAQAYAEEHRRNIEREVLGMANDMNRAGATGLTELQLVELLHRQQRARRLGEAYLINGAREILHRGEFSYAFTYERPNEDQMTEARLGQVVVVEDQENNELRALVQIGNIFDTYLYVSRPIDGEVLLLLDETQATVAFYNQIEAQRGTLLSAFALVYLGFALLVIATAVWLALWLAERLSRPIGALAFAAERVGDGDLDIRVPEDGSKDEVALLSRIFNRMTAQVKGQRDQLLQANRDSEQRRNFIETVLSGVSAGVIGIDGEGRMEMANDAATAMLGGAITGRDDLPAEIRKVHEAADASALGSAQAQVQLEVGGEKRDFLVRVSARSSSDHSLGYVMTIDDLTALVSAQREAAWGDVARRIAHEIKNPLTPIQLSAERLRRKFAPMVEKDRESFEQYADVIVRQTGDIRRMVDEFSKFARMPKPEKKTEDLSALTRDAV
ncbi:MAG: histidine kinase dimerization/phospho-acceptor domain-containing protein, partial [Pseudomonadota bacterium]